MNTLMKEVPSCEHHQRENSDGEETLVAEERQIRACLGGSYLDEARG